MQAKFLCKAEYMVNAHENLQLRGPDIPPNIREAYLQAVSSISPFDPIEAQDILATLQWLKDAPYLNKPHNMDRHLGVLCPVLSPDLKSTFLMNHKKAQMWLPPGGHVDFGVTLDQAASQELREELGMENPSPDTSSPSNKNTHPDTIAR